MIHLYFNCAKTLPSWQMTLNTLNRRSETGARPEMFHGRGGFVELGRFDKHFVKNTKRPHRQKFWCFFWQIFLKQHFEEEILTQRWKKSIFKKVQGRPPSSLCALSILPYHFTNFPIIMPFDFLISSVFS